MRGALRDDAQPEPYRDGTARGNGLHRTDRRPSALEWTLRRRASARFYVVPATGLPHVHGHQVSEDEVTEVLDEPGEVGLVEKVPGLRLAKHPRAGIRA